MRLAIQAGHDVSRENTSILDLAISTLGLTRTKIKFDSITMFFFNKKEECLIYFPGVYCYARLPSYCPIR